MKPSSRCGAVSVGSRAFRQVACRWSPPRIWSPPLKSCCVLRRTSRTFSLIAVGFGVVGAVLLTAQALRGTLSSLKRRRMRCAGAPCLTAVLNAVQPFFGMF